MLIVKKPSVSIKPNWSLINNIIVTPVSDDICEDICHEMNYSEIFTKMASRQRTKKVVLLEK